MARDETLAGVESRTIETGRLETHLLESGDPADGGSVVFLHGNVSSARFFEDVMADPPSSRYAIAPDLRGCGDSETKPLDATTASTTSRPISRCWSTNSASRRP
ncbi:hypothetical protein SAMN05443661_10782 [Natronobacterium gregoryi]|uniref:Alpha/beta hydrolase fold protein n=1 Tax=Natronobacterium gregoryi TaxID=44930 RepID=A0A1I3LLD1_9EURY|nr:hypothetical protein SAMN05443661_10782 [Natronobacterium gregoryi]